MTERGASACAHAFMHVCRLCLCMLACGFDYVSLCVFCKEINNNIITQGSLLKSRSLCVCVFKNRSHVLE